MKGPATWLACFEGRREVKLRRRALGEIRAGVASLEAGEGEAAGSALREASRIIADLHADIDFQKASERLARLKPLYKRVCTRLTDAALLNDPAAAREAEWLLGPLAGRSRPWSGKDPIKGT